MSKPVVKKKVDSKKAAEAEYAAWLEQIKLYHAVAERAYKKQTKSTREALDAVTDRVVALSQGIVQFHGHRFQVPPVLMRKNALYAATEFFKDLALLDIRVADFEFLEEVCAECGKPVGKVAKKKGEK